MVSRGVFTRDDCITADQKGMTGLVYISIEARWLRRMRFSMLYPIQLVMAPTQFMVLARNIFKVVSLRVESASAIRACPFMYHHRIIQHKSGSNQPARPCSLSRIH